MKVIMSVFDEGYNAPDEGYSRNTSCGPSSLRKTRNCKTINYVATSYQ
jgi:hypothetical protein